MTTSEEMDADKTVLEDLITQTEAEIELNPVEHIVVGNVEFSEWKKVYATVTRTAVKNALYVKMATLKANVLAYKKLAMDKQASLPVVETPVPQPTSGGQGDQLTS